MRLLVMRPAGKREDDLVGVLSHAGTHCVVVPAIRLVEISEWSVPRGDFDWVVFTSEAAAHFFVKRARTNSLQKVAAVGARTAVAISRLGLAVSWMPSVYTTEAIGRELSGPSRVLLVRASYADTDLERSLERRGFGVERIDVYATEFIGADEIVQSLNEGVDAVAFTSPSIVDSFAASRARLRDEQVCSIGPATSKACSRWGLRVDVEAVEHTGAGLARAIIERSRVHV